MKQQANAATVALIASSIIERKVKFGALDNTDFSTYEIPGQKRSYYERTQEQACKEAWSLVQAAERTRPED